MRAAGYGRVSTEEQASEGYSLEAQREKNIAFIQLQNWTLVGYFSDPGYSGKNLNRPDMQRLIQEIERGNVDVLVVHKLDRLTRNIGDLYDLLELFERHRVKFVSITENIDTSTAMGRMFVFLLGIFAQWYRENLAEEVRKGMSQRAKKGLHNVTVPLYGYERTKDGKLIAKPEEAKWVKWIFEEYLAGKGSSNIAKRLNDMGIRRNRGAKWDQHKVMLTLTNWHYIGKVHWKEADKPENERIIAQGDHEAIISPETFEAAQRLLKRRKEGFASRTSYEYVYSGIVRCGKCGGTYKGKYNKRGKSNNLYRGYVCSNNERYGSCDQSGISEMNLTKLLFDSIQTVHHLPNWSDNADQRNEREEIRKLLEASEARRSRWQMAFGDGYMPYEDFAKRMKEEMVRAAELERKLAELPEDIPSRITFEEAVTAMEELKQNWPLLDQMTRKQTIQSIFRSITILKESGKWRITRLELV